MVKDLGSSNLAIICIHINNKGQRTHIQIIKKTVGFYIGWNSLVWRVYLELSCFSLGEIPWYDVYIWSCPVLHWVKNSVVWCIYLELSGFTLVKFRGLMCMFGAVRLYIGWNSLAWCVYLELSGFTLGEIPWSDVYIWSCERRGPDCPRLHQLGKVISEYK